MSVSQLVKIRQRFFEWLPENNRLERIWIFAKIDFRKRYYDNILGLFWAFFNPMLQVGIYYVVFTIIFTNRIENFALYLFMGLLFWMFFVEGTKKGIRTLQQKKYLIENIAFNKLDLFISATFSVFFGFIFNCMAFAVICLISQIPISLNILFLPAIISNMFVLVLAISILLATIAIFLKDIDHIWNMLILAGFWATPIFYNPEILLEKMPAVLYLNPVAGIIINARLVTLYASPPDYFFFAYCFIYSFVLLGLSIFVFNKYSHIAAERL